MATKIIHRPTEFKPVKIEMEFTSREQLAAFIQVMHNPISVAESIRGKFPVTKQAELMNVADICDAIDELTTTEVLDKLAKLADV